jgi:hypothetical protein
MKKFLKYYLPILMIFLSLSFLFLVYVEVYVEKNHPILIWYLIGRARVHSQTISSVVKVNEKEQITAKVFKVNKDKFLIYIPDSDETYPVIIVDKARRDIGSTDAGKTRYELLFDRYLLQSDSAYAIIYASDAVKWGYNANLEMTASRISYTTPKLEDDKFVDIKVEILFKGE